MVGALFDMGPAFLGFLAGKKQLPEIALNAIHKSSSWLRKLLGPRTGLWAPQRECRKGVRRRTPGPDCTSGAPMRQLPCDLEFSSQSTSWASPPQWQDEPKWLPL